MVGDVVKEYLGLVSLTEAGGGGCSSLDLLSEGESSQELEGRVISIERCGGNCSGWVIGELIVRCADVTVDGLKSSGVGNCGGGLEDGTKANGGNNV